MKRNVKGFTLIELIVVLAIFGLILVGAMNLLPPVRKVMTYTEVHEEGNAVVDSITQYLEGSLSSAEYLDVYNTMPASDADRVALVQGYAQTYYDGVLRGGSGTEDAAINYASGRIHVMTIDNANGGKISEYVYSCDFGDNANKVAGICNISELSGSEAVNKVAYQNYTHEIRLGTYDETTWLDPSSYVSFASAVTAKNTCFSIKSSTTRNNGNDTYNFYNTASLSLMNIMQRSTTGVPNYFVINYPNSGAGDTTTKAIVSVTAPHSSRKANTALTQAPYDQIPSNTRVFYTEPPAGSTALDNYTLIYSYGSEINTNP